MAKFIKTDEELEKEYQENYERYKETPENMSYWLPKLQESPTRHQSCLKVPETKTVTLSYEWWEWLHRDKYTKEKINEFNRYMQELLGDFQKGKRVFMETGVFSNKFSFNTAVIEDRDNVGKQFLDMYYTSLVFGANETNEVVFREMVEDKEDRHTIYQGMPLHTEFRVFYDYDTHKAVGVSNYWHPDVMKRMQSDKDKESYSMEQDRIIKEYEEYKQDVVKQVELFMKGCTTLTGRWSVDVMKNDTDFWLIDMARMERSALLERMEEL